MRQITIKEVKPQISSPFDENWQYRLRVVVEGWCNHANAENNYHTGLTECPDCNAWKHIDERTWENEDIQEIEPTSNNGVLVQL